MRDTKPTAPAGALPMTPVTTFQGPWPSPVGDGGPADMVALGARLAYAYDRDDVGITAYGLDSGEPVWHTAVPDGVTVARTPRLVGDKVIGAFDTTEEGSGTYADRRGITVVALDARTGRSVWSREIPGGKDRPAEAAPHVVGADSRHVLVASYEEGYAEAPPLSALLDSQTGQVIWSDADFKGVDLEGSVAVGMRGDGDFVGKATSDGDQLWKRDLRLGEAMTSDPGPGLTRADGTQAGGTLLIDPVTGATRLNSGDTSLSSCHYDGWNTTVCAGADGSGEATVWAVDVRTARVLWRLPDEAAGRTAPDITSAWHGVVYARADQAMTLDARTGSDLRTDLGAVSPSLVNDGYGLVYDPLARAIDVYRATGTAASD
ncbi:outer membrane protein assembly factor BamB family protein [Streptomyces telluris]|uniref:PQQ-binding-like beta-propeller repeat protein n=1 Tax=Streptomyces telluris TaxID=2720021 RepID=A0A9X2RMI1_9ACTN|nr:PQQ-binding-like beta-propeller repeat protein [Streptomyces telluris]MCQ8771957.1 PQQ-binding-like beta-propeller repeat protein [Streptomyces telluris]NJP78372.1 PQQ-binding-like beta-propeller repeat protein [Streptomyces telluris]